ncbi:vacuolar protein sorting-associated protein 1 [Entophlyctis sp. JEL0112]|nr:vacuolar protein sorting-associated protein 1 [Entophlyctis sp. JEL0112]
MNETSTLANIPCELLSAITAFLDAVDIMRLVHASVAVSRTLDDVFWRSSMRSLFSKGCRPKLDEYLPHNRAAFMLCIRNEARRGDWRPFSRDQQTLFGALTRARAEVPEWIMMPLICVAGNCRSGKSTIVERLVGRGFLPIQQSQIAPANRSIEVHMRHRSDPGDCWLVDDLGPFTEAAQVREALSNILHNKKPGDESSNIAIKVQLWAADVPDMIVVDTASPAYTLYGGIFQPIVQQYMEHATLILAVSSAIADVANSTALRSALEYDPQRIRTLGVLTKVDLMDLGVDCVDVLANRVVILPFGFVPLVNCRGQFDQDERERKFFASQRPYKKNREYCGIKFLRARIINILRFQYRTALHGAENLKELRSTVAKSFLPEVAVAEAHVHALTLLTSFWKICSGSMICNDDDKAALAAALTEFIPNFESTEAHAISTLTEIVTGWVTSLFLAFKSLVQSFELDIAYSSQCDFCSIGTVCTYQGNTSAVVDHFEKVVQNRFAQINVQRALDAWIAGRFRQLCNFENWAMEVNVAGGAAVVKSNWCSSAQFDCSGSAVDFHLRCVEHLGECCHSFVDLVRREITEILDTLPANATELGVLTKPHQLRAVHRTCRVASQQVETLVRMEHCHEKRMRQSFESQEEAVNCLQSHALPSLRESVPKCIVHHFISQLDAAIYQEVVADSVFGLDSSFLMLTEQTHIVEQRRACLERIAAFDEIDSVFRTKEKSEIVSVFQKKAKSELR